MNKVVGVRLLKCPFKFKLCSYSEKVIIFLSSLAFLFAWMKLWISSFRSRIHTSSLSLPYTPPTPTYFFSSHTNIFFLLPHQHILSSGFNEMENPMMCTGIKSVQTHKGSLQNKFLVKVGILAQEGGGGSDPIPTFFQNWPKPNLPWKCP